MESVKSKIIRVMLIFDHHFLIYDLQTAKSGLFSTKSPDFGKFFNFFTFFGVFCVCTFKATYINYAVLIRKLTIEVADFHEDCVVIFYTDSAAVAQLVERVLGKDEVMGPIPISS